MDRILISDLSVRCIIGVNEEERRKRQDEVINPAIHAHLRKAGRSDRFEDTVDYRAVKKRIVSMAVAASSLLRSFRDSAATRQEFLSLVSRSKLWTAGHRKVWYGFGGLL